MKLSRKSLIRYRFYGKINLCRLRSNEMSMNKQTIGLIMLYAESASFTWTKCIQRIPWERAWCEHEFTVFSPQIPYMRFIFYSDYGVAKKYDLNIIYINCRLYDFFNLTWQWNRKCHRRTCTEYIFLANAIDVTMYIHTS